MDNFLRLGTTVFLVCCFVLTIPYSALSQDSREGERREIPAGPFTYGIDPSLRVEGKASVSVVQDPKGGRDEFVADHVILYAPDEGVLNKFRTTYNAEIIKDGSLPPPPEIIPEEEIRRGITKSNFYLLKVDLRKADMSQFPVWMEELGFRGRFLFSSDEAVRLSAILAKERVVNNLDVTPDILFRVLSPDCVLCRTEEHPTGQLYLDSFLFQWVNDPKIQLSKAWQYFDLLDLDLKKRGISLAVIDLGFGFNQDFPPKNQIPQYDYEDDDYDAAASSSEEKSGTFEWHGLRSMSAAIARLDNKFGSVGTAGLAVPAIRPMAFRISDDGAFVGGWRLSSAIRTATSWGADVINISISGDCDFWCQLVWDACGMQSLTNAIGEATDSDVIVVAAAGNDNKDLDDSTELPCEIDGVICVGAIDLKKKEKAGYSNYGSKVDISTPAIPAIDTTPDPGSQELSRGSGTSIATPYLSGIIAMMKVIDTSLNAAKAQKVLQDTANKSTDSKLKYGYVNAYAAVKKIAAEKGLHPKGDKYEPNNTEVSATPIDLKDKIIATRAIADDDYYAFEVQDYMDVALYVTYKDVLTTGNKLYTSLDGVWSTAGLNAGQLFHGVGMLMPGKHSVIVSGTDANTMNCYDIDVSYLKESNIVPDSYEGKTSVGNDSFQNRAFIAGVVMPSSALGANSYIYDLNFHSKGDIDYFEIQLPASTKEKPECLKPGDKSYNDPNSRQGALSIEPFPDPASLYSWNWPFEIAVYNNKGVIFSSTTGSSLKIECPQNYFKDGKIRFSVRGKDGRRNFYRIALNYVRWSKGSYVPPGKAYQWEQTKPPVGPPPPASQQVGSPMQQFQQRTKSQGKDFKENLQKGY